MIENWLFIWSKERIRENLFLDDFVARSGRGFEDYTRWFVSRKNSLVYDRFRVVLFFLRVSKCSNTKYKSQSFYIYIYIESRIEAKRKKKEKTSAVLAIIRSNGCDELIWQYKRLFYFANILINFFLFIFLLIIFHSFVFSFNLDFAQLIMN